MGLEEAAQHARRAAELIKSGSYEAAIEAARQATSADESFADGHSLLGMALSRTGRPRDAETAFRRALELEPTAKSYYNLAAHLFAIGDRLKAEELARAALALEPGHEASSALLRSIEWERDNSHQPPTTFPQPRPQPGPSGFVAALGWSWTLAGCFIVFAYVATRTILLARFTQSAPSNPASMTQNEQLAWVSDLFSQNTGLMIGAFVWLLLLAVWWCLDYVHWRRDNVVIYVVIGLLDAVVFMCCTYGLALVVMFTVYLIQTRRTPSYPGYR
jgi:tetratricopeptide (TPR) repeat protein